MTDLRKTGELVENETDDADESGLVRALLSAVHDGIVLFDDEHAVRAVNDSARDMLGLPAGSLAGTRLSDLVEQSRLLKPGLLARQLRNAVDSPENSAAIHVVEDTEGQLHCLEVSTTRTDLWGRVGFIGTFRDITDWQQLHQYQLLAEIGRLSAEKTSLDDMAVRLLDTIFDTLNVDIAVLALFDREHLRPVMWRGMMLDPELSADPLANAYVEKALELRRPVEGDGAEWEGDSGGELTGVHYVVPLLFSGKTLGTLHLSALQTIRLFKLPGKEHTDPAASLDRLDSTVLAALGGYVGAALQNVRLFEENAQERARLRSLIERVPEGIVLFNARGEILVANSAARRIAEIPWKNLNTDSRPYRLCDDQGRPLPRGEWPFFRAVRTGGSALNERIILDYGDRKKHLEVSVVPVPSVDGHAASFVGTLKDVTARSQQERRKDEFLSVASHELRSPLTPLMGFIQMLKRQVERGDRADAGLVQRAEQQVSRLSRLIDGLLDMTRIETGRMVLARERVDVARLVRRTIEPWRAHCANDIAVSVDEEPLMAHVDADRLDQVLTNILDNAIKHSPDDTPIEVDVVTRGNDIRIGVRDYGEGMDEEALEHIFERFYRADKDNHTGSMGLGLYITREIVEQHGGTIEIDSGPGEGTTVKISLPRDPH